MIYFILITIGIGAFEIKEMLSKKLKKEIILWILIAIPTIVFGIYYLSNPYADSFCKIIFNVFNMKY